MRLPFIGVLLGVLLSGCTSQSGTTSYERQISALLQRKTQAPLDMDSIVVRLNQTERVMVDRTTVPIDSLEGALEKARAEKGLQTKFVFKVSKKTIYAVFIQAQGAIESQVYKERNRLAEQLFQKHYEKLSPNEKSRVHQEIPLLIEEHVLN